VQGGMAVTLRLFIWEMMGSNIGQVTGYSDRTIRGPPEYLKAKAGKGPRLDHDCFIQKYFQFTIHQLSYHLTLNQILKTM
jgi:hypothetical protein